MQDFREVASFVIDQYLNEEGKLRTEALTRKGREWYDPETSPDERSRDVPRRKIHTHASENGIHRVEIHKGGAASGSEPFRVKLYVKGMHYSPADYFTDDLEDAHGTAKSMLSSAESRNFNPEDRVTSPAPKKSRK